MPNKKAVTPKRGTIASRYLQAISNQAAAAAAVDKNEKQSRNNNSSDSNNTSFLSSLDCSMTASTTLLDQSESWTTNGTKKSRSSGAAAVSVPTTPTRRRRSGTTGNSNHNSSSYHGGGPYTPGSQSTMPLSGSLSAPSSRPATPTKHLPPPGTSTTARSIMDHDEDDSSSLESSPSTQGGKNQQQLAIEIGGLEQEEHLMQQEEQLQALQKAIGMSSISPINSRPTTPTANRSQRSSSSSSNRHGMFPRTTPRTPTKSQPDDDSYYSMKHNTETKSPRSSNHSLPTTPTTYPRPKAPNKSLYGSEAGAPTEVMTNRTRDVLLQHRLPSEAGSAQPTEVMTNRTSDVLSRVRQTWNSSREKNTREFAGGMGNANKEEHSPTYAIPHHSGRVSNYWNHKKSGGGDNNIPSLMDSQSSSMSLPDDRRPEPNPPRQSHSAHGRLLNSLGTPALQHDSRLSKHVQKARQQSILSPSMSETTASLPSVAAAVVNEPRRDDDRLLGNRNDPITEEHESEGEASGRHGADRTVEWNNASGNGRVAALAAQFRRTKWTIRGAQQQQQQHMEQYKKQSAIEEKIRKKGAQTPDPIISVAGSEHDGDDYNRYHDDVDDESTLPEYTERHERGAAERADEFVVYNERSVKNAAAVFQSRGSSDSPDDVAEGESQGGQRRRSFSQHSRASTERGKSPIQPLFSLDRVDLESSDPPSQYRGGRSMTPEQFLRTADDDFERLEQPRRGNSLSRSLERNLAIERSSNRSIDPVDLVPDVLIFDKMRHDEDEDNSVLEEELVHIMERTGEREEGRSQNNALPRRGRIDEITSTSIRAKTPSTSGRRTPSGSGHSSVLTTKSVKDKIREFNMRTPEKWRKSPGVTTPTVPERKHADDNKDREYNKRHSTRETEEEKKEDGPFAHEEDDSSVKSLRDKLEKRFTQRHSSMGFDKQAGVEQDEDDYSVQSLREKLEQRIQDAGNEFGEEFGDDRSVRSLRERFEKPASKQKGENVSNLRAMFESKPNTTPASLVQSIAKPSRDSRPRSAVTPAYREDERPTFDQSDDFDDEANEMQQHNVGRSEEPYVQRDTYDDKRQESITEANNKGKAGQPTEEWIDFESSYEQPQENNPSLHFKVNAAKNELGRHGNQPYNSRNYPTSSANTQHSPESIEESMRKERSISPREKKQNFSGPKGTKIVSRINQWANSRQSTSTSPLAAQEIRLQVGHDDFPAVERTGSYDMSPVRDGAGSPDTDALIAAVAVPGSHWASSGTSNVQHRKLPQRGDVKGASSETDYSDAVTLDASIADVSLLTNPSAIRTMGSDMDRKSDTSSSVLQLLAHKSEASSSQPSEALAPLIPDPLQHKSDDSTHMLEQFASSAPKKEHHREETIEASQHDLMSSTPGIPGEKLQSEWEDYKFDTGSPFRKEPPDDPFKLDPVGSDAFSDSAWQDFGDSKDFAPAGRNREVPSRGHTSRWSPDPPANSGSLSHAIPMKADPPSTPSRKSPSRQQSSTRSGSVPSIQPQYLPYTGRAVSVSASTSLPNRTPPRQQQLDQGQQWRFDSTGPTTSLQRSPSRLPIAPQQLNTTHRASAAFPPSDYGPSRDERSRQRFPVNNIEAPAPSESSIKVPEVPPLPSPFDPNYASIMAARHKMLLSRQRALLHRRAAREQMQQSTPSTHGGFFGRTHPERPTRVAEVHLPIQLSQNVKAIRGSSLPSMRFTAHSIASTQEPWEAFGPNDPTQKAFEALTRPSRLSPMRGVQNDPPYIYNTENPPTATPKRRAQRPSHTSQGRADASLFSKVKSTLGLESEYRHASQSEAVIARITAVRAARMKRYHEKNAPNLSYRQRVIDREALKGSPGFDDEPLVGATNGYRFYTHDDPKTFDAHFSADGGDSLSTSSNAVEYAATLEVD